MVGNNFDDTMASFSDEQCLNSFSYSPLDYYIFRLSSVLVTHIELDSTFLKSVFIVVLRTGNQLVLNYSYLQLSYPFQQKTSISYLATCRRYVCHFSQYLYRCFETSNVCDVTLVKLIQGFGKLRKILSSLFGICSTDKCRTKVYQIKIFSKCCKCSNDKIAYLSLIWRVLASTNIYRIRKSDYDRLQVGIE